MFDVENKNNLGKHLLTLYVTSIFLVSFGMLTNQSFATDASSTFTNSTDTNSTLSFNGYSNSTLSFNGYSNTTSINSTMSDQLNINDTVVVNLTSQTSQSLVQKNTNVAPMKFNGSEYITANVSPTTNLRNLTVSAWVKPDYSQGSPVFTVISNENAFILAVNNNLPPSKQATFSVFDGIKWTTVQSNNTIQEQWTHLAATFNGTSITIYVNGKLEGITPIMGIPTITIDGNLATKTVQNLTSNADTVIGGYYDSVRLHTRDLFSGKISNANLYASILTPTQINQMYNNTKPSDDN